MKEPKVLRLLPVAVNILIRKHSDCEVTDSLFVYVTKKETEQFERGPGYC